VTRNRQPVLAFLLVLLLTNSAPAAAGRHQAADEWLALKKESEDLYTAAWREVCQLFPSYGGCG
jgi:hypothetical protein